MKYKIFKFENGLDRTWYQIKLKWWLFFFWVKERNFSSEYIKSFQTEEECRKWIKNQEEYEKHEALLQQIKITELPGLDGE